MIESIVFIVAILSDQLLKYWVRGHMFVPGEKLPLFGSVLGLQYAQNYGGSDQVSFLRGRSLLMNIVRILQVVVVLYLLIAQRKRLATITRVGLVLFLAGLLGNQWDYFTQGFVTDMFYFPFLERSIVFNLADVWIFIGMIIILIRVAFFEGQVLVNDLFGKKGKHPDEQ